MLRESCTVCTSTALRLIYKQDEYPVCISSSSCPLESDIFQTLQFVGCNHCGCVQLKNLIDPSLLYSFSHNNTYETPTWNQHHHLFSEFILENTGQTKLVEIGGASGYLAELLQKKRKDISISIIDLAQQPDMKVSVEYIQANCEEFDFTTIDSSTPIILSHVFEHLYRPRKLVEQLEKAKTQTLFISIPNMEVCLQKKFFSFLHVEHTYYCTSVHIKRMMAEAGFQCIQEVPFKEHSLFFHFERQGILEMPPYPDAEQILSRFNEYYKDRDALYSQIYLKQPTYIVPGGHYGQLIFNYLKKQKTNIIGFLDNDKSKIGKRMYGTDKYVYPMRELETKKDTNVSVLLNAGPYLEEIKVQLLGYHPGVDMICV
jgi:2-polyprenyl-3-methyl-5-hydroxy-6-metoxy-1,4-benzoquinol methylase